MSFPDCRRSEDVVRDIVDQRVAEDCPNPQEEQVELKRLSDEGSEWVRLAGLLLDGATADQKEDSKEDKEVIQVNFLLYVAMYV